MAVVHGPDSAYAQEMRKWNAHHSEYSPPGRPYTYQPYPSRLYKAGRVAGRAEIVDAATAHDEHEQRNLESRGFVAGGQQAALEALAAQEQRDAVAHAELNYDVRRMSEGAQAEYAAHEAAAGIRHLSEVPETPITRRGRKPKGVTPSVTE